MRILAERILAPVRDRRTGRVGATVCLLVGGTGAGPTEVRLAVSAPARAPGSPPLRRRLAAQAKLILYAESARAGAARRAA